MTGEAGPVGGFFALFDPLLRGSALVVEADDGLGRRDPRQRPGAWCTARRRHHRNTPPRAGSHSASARPCRPSTFSAAGARWQTPPTPPWASCGLLLAIADMR